MSEALDDLLYLVARLRDPDSGCPWDLKQTPASIVPYTLEECYELADAIERGDTEHMRQELGDVLFQVALYCQMASERGEFGFDDVVAEIVSKLVRRHPHVFPAGTLRGEAGAGPDAIAVEAVKHNWEAIKKEERAGKAQHGVLDDVPLALPALTRAAKLQKRAAQVGFDWASTAGVLDKLAEELAELQSALATEGSAAVADELGDLLFTCVNLARHLGVDPETALRHGNQKFEGRFRYVEAQLAAQGVDPATAGADRMNELWMQAKARGL